MNSKQSGFLASAVANVLLYAAFLVPPSKVAHPELAAIFLPLILSCSVYAWSCGLGAIAAINTLWAVDLLVFRNPRENFQVNYRRTKRFQDLSLEKEHGETVWKESYPESFKERIWWVGKLLGSIRFVGWEASDERAATLNCANFGKRRLRWLFRELIIAVTCFLVMDAAAPYQLFDQYFLRRADIHGQLPNFIAIIFGGSNLYELTPHLTRAAIFGLQQYCIFAMVCTLSATWWVSLVGLGLADEWCGGIRNSSPLPGKHLATSESGLRGFWGIFWHQLFRTLCPSN